MQHDDPFENSSYRTTERRIPWIGIFAACVLIAALTWIAGPDRANNADMESARGADRHADDQAAQP